MKKLYIRNINIGIIGLGYVGLPLAIEFNKKFSIVAFDINSKRINELNSKIDRNNEFNLKTIHSKKNILFTDRESKLNNCNVYIITVPTPINSRKKPDLSNILNASDH